MCGLLTVAIWSRLCGLYDFLWTPFGVGPHLPPAFHVVVSKVESGKGANAGGANWLMSLMWLDVDVRQ